MNPYLLIGKQNGTIIFGWVYNYPLIIQCYDIFVYYFN